jgi:hypothetical protein
VAKLSTIHNHLDTKRVSYWHPLLYKIETS